MNLSKLTDSDLLTGIKKLVTHEREILIEVLHHLKELDSRRLYLEQGYPSLWAYCIQELKYSEAAAHRRIQAMRALRDIPILQEKIESGSLTLSNIAKAQSVLRKCQLGREDKLFSKDDVVTSKINIFLKLENKSQKAAEQILASHFPDAIRPNENLRYINSEEVAVKLTLTKDQLEKIEQVKSLFSHQHPYMTLAQTIEVMAEFVIKAKGALAIKNKDGSLVNTKCNLGSKIKYTSKVIESELTIQPPQRRLRSPKKAVSAAAKREVWAKAGGACQFVSKESGRRCSGNHQLEVEHIQPRAFGGSNDLKNLKLFCRAHNRQAARNATLMG